MKIAIIGAGNMGGSIARGIAAAQLAEVRVANPSQAKLDALKHDCPAITVCADNIEAARGADIVLLAVKPWVVPAVVEEIKPELDYSHQAVASVAAGISTADLAAMLAKDGAEPPVYYIIPNTAIAHAQSMTFIARRNGAETLDAAVLEIFNALGTAMLVEERLMGAGTALASCGIAYVLRYIRAMEEGGVQLGFYPRDARNIVLATMQGAISLLQNGDSHPEAEIDKVTTPGGMTIRGLNAMEEAGFTHAVISGLLASLKK